VIPFFILLDWTFGKAEVIDWLPLEIYFFILGYPFVEIEITDW
jgi:hypothetical protein